MELIYLLFSCPQLCAHNCVWHLNCVRQCALTIATQDNPADLWQLRHWLQFLQLRTWIHDNICYLTIKSDSALWRKPHWKWEIKEFAKMTTSPPIFGRYELFQIEYLDTTFGQFHFLAYIWSELIIQRRQTFLIALFSWSSSRLAEGCEKSEGTTWTDS